MRARLFALSVTVAGCGLWAGGADGPGSSGDARDAGPDAWTSPADAALDAPPPKPFVPSHTSATFDLGASDLVDPTQIDTSKLQLAFGGALAAPPSGIDFKDASGVAVLRVGAWKQSVGVIVTGSRPLIVLASKAAFIAGRVDVAADHATPGPGGAEQAKGPGKGAGGEEGAYCDPGGGGAGFGDIGGAGGAPPCGSANAGAGGVLYGAKLVDFGGGSGGGKGAGNCGGFGGGGGGAIQIASLARIDVIGGGAIDASGGGGGGGCRSPGNGGGGGGSGGLVFLEAPAIDVGGALGANGGGGGEGGYADLFNGRDGQDGANGLPDLTPAAGGGASSTDRPGGVGGARAAPAGQPPAKANVDNTGGGGGAVGRIWLRTRGAQATTPSGKISPAPSFDTSL